MPMSARRSKTGSRRPAPREPFPALAAALRDLPPGGKLDLGGLPGSGPAWLLARTLSSNDGSVRGPVLVVCPDEISADRFAADLDFFLRASTTNGGEGQGPAATSQVVRLPADESLPYEDGTRDRDTLMSRMAALDHLRRGSARVLVGSARALSQRLPPPSVSDTHGFSLRPGDEVGRGELAKRLALAGYQNAPLVEDPGSFALRGGIIDLWSMRQDQPVRIELFGDEIESIRSFDPETQRTLAVLDHAEVSPAGEALFSSESIRRATAGVRELAGELGLPTRSVRGVVDEIERGQTGLGVEAFLPAFYEGGLVPLAKWLEGFDLLFTIDPAGCDARLLELWAHASAAHEEARARGAVVFPPQAHFLEPEEALESVSSLRRLYVHELLIEEQDRRAIRFDLSALDDLRRPSLGESEEMGTLGPFVRRLHEWRGRGRTVALAATSPGQADRLRRLLEDRDVSVHPATGPLDPADPRSLGHQLVELHLLVGEVSTGFEDPETGLVLVAEADLLGTRPAKGRRRGPSRRRVEETFATGFQDLTEGDLVVHVEHGIGRYQGLRRLSIRGISGDFLLIEYAGRDKIYLPVHRLGLVQRYVGGEGEGVRLDRLGSKSFALRKKKVKEELLKMAAELLDIYAARKAHPGTAFGPPDQLFREFEAAFPYEETEDQSRAIEEVLSDMRREEPMDRLVCGDVGYGK
ncbi:MAG: CarD family transcriptional regulator, partial [Myxococcota bacterium]